MIGIDIGTKFIKACQVDMRGGTVYDINSVIHELPDGGASPAVKEAVLKNILERGRFTTKKAAVSAGGPDVVVRNAEFPPLAEEELRNSVKFNAEKFIYTSLSGMDMDLSILKKEDSKLRVLVAAAPSEVVNSKIELVQSAGCYAEIADIDNLAMVNCFLKMNPGFTVENRSVVLVNTGHANTEFAVIKGDELFFSKTVKFGGADITAGIANELGIEAEEAEKLKRSPEKWVSSGLNIKNVLRRSTPDLIENVHRAIEFCRSGNLIDSAEAIYMTGGTSMISGLCSMISDTLGIETRVWNPLEGLSDDRDISSGPLLAVAAGLALRD